MSRRIAARVIAALLVPACAAAAAEAGELVQRKTVSFRLDQPIALDLSVGGLRVVDLQIARDSGPLLKFVETPRGGTSRWSWLSYALGVENPSDRRSRLRVLMRLKDRNGAVIDEFEFSELLFRGRARRVDLKRLTLNYVIDLIDSVELELAATR